MYNIGEHVVYGIHGVCRIVDMEDRVIDRKLVHYYVLEPLDQSGARFLVPTHNANAVAKMRPVLSREALEDLLHSEEVKLDTWISDENARKQRYRELINSGDRTALVQMVGTLYRHKKSQAAMGRKFHLCDENFLRDAQKLLDSEFSMVLGMDQKQVVDYISHVLQAE